jgi:hypothetical protein
MEFSIQYHVTINSQLNNQNSIRYYIISTNQSKRYVKSSMIMLETTNQTTTIQAVVGHKLLITFVSGLSRKQAVSHK